MSTSFIEETSHTRIDLHNRLLDAQNELQGKSNSSLRIMARILPTDATETAIIPVS